MKFTVFSAIAAIACITVPGASASKPQLRRAAAVRASRPARGAEQAAVIRGQERPPAASVGSSVRASTKAKGKEGHDSKKCSCSTTSTKKSNKDDDDCCHTTSKSSKSDDTKERDCRWKCEQDYCPNDGSCIQKCKECCTPEFVCDDGDFPISEGEGNKRTVERCSLFGGECDARNEFCRVADYACNHESNPSGVCMALDGNVKRACPMSYTPVCGCDGVTYGNSCLAHAAGMNVATNSECETPGNGGEECRLGDFTCTPGLYCHVGKYTCGEESNPKGRCVSMPLQCTGDIREVCGCDGKTYANSCAAYAAGVNILKNEACPKQSRLGDDCELDNMGYCGNGLFCKVRNYYCKHEVNPQGICRYEPRAQTCPYENDPVCGCNCKTYGNECQALAAGTNVYSKGSCPKDGCEYPGSGLEESQEQLTL